MAPSPFDPKAAKKSPSPPPEGEGCDFDGDLDAFLAYRALNDLGNSERLIKRHGEDLRYVRDVGWAAWDGRRWDQVEGAERAQLAAQETARAIRGEITATAKENEDFSKALGRWARDSGGSGKIAAMQREARPHITVASDEEWRSFVRALGDPDWAADPRFAHGPGRLEHHGEIDDHIGRWTEQRAKYQVMRELQEAGGAAGPGMDQRDAYIDPHPAERGVHPREQRGDPWFRPP